MQLERGSEPRQVVRWQLQAVSTRAGGPLILEAVCGPQMICSIGPDPTLEELEYVPGRSNLKVRAAPFGAGISPMVVKRAASGWPNAQSGKR